MTRQNKTPAGKLASGREMEHDGWGLLSLTQLYHISPRVNDEMIHQSGLLPERSKTQAARVYAVEYKLIPWSLAHVSQRHDTAVSALTIWTMPHDDRWRRFGGGIWYCTEVVRPDLSLGTTAHVLSLFL